MRNQPYTSSVRNGAALSEKNHDRYLAVAMLLLILLLMMIDLKTRAQAAVYGSGTMYRNRSYAINELENSGFVFLILQTLDSDASGNFNIDFLRHINSSSYPSLPAMAIYSSREISMH